MLLKKNRPIAPHESKSFTILQKKKEIWLIFQDLNLNQISPTGFSVKYIDNP